MLGNLVKWGQFQPDHDKSLRLMEGPSGPTVGCWRDKILNKPSALESTALSR